MKLYEKEQESFLVINADDYGYYECVSRGILECAEVGSITAINVMANGPKFSELVGALHTLCGIDFGVHLNITLGEPLSRGMRKLLEKYGGHFQDRYTMACLVAMKRIPIEVVKQEWRAQIEKCLCENLRILFLNTHEHMHMLPFLRNVFLEIAEEYNIEFVRFIEPEWKYMKSFINVINNCYLSAVRGMCRKGSIIKSLRLVGLNMSCRLDLEYLRTCIMKLRSGETYELMCHPGYCNKSEIGNSRILRYHLWEQERKLLCSDAMNQLCEEFKVKVIRYRDIL